MPWQHQPLVPIDYHARLHLITEVNQMCGNQNYSAVVKNEFIMQIEARGILLHYESVSAIQC